MNLSEHLAAPAARGRHLHRLLERRRRVVDGVRAADARSAGHDFLRARRHLAHERQRARPRRSHLQNTRLQPWYYPSRNDCVTCHTTASGGVLGPKTRQLNGNLALPERRDRQPAPLVGARRALRQSAAGSADPESRQTRRAHDRTATLEKRGRSYLDANCANCHRPGGAQAFWDARFDTPLAQQGIALRARGQQSRRSERARGRAAGFAPLDAAPARQHGRREFKCRRSRAT